MKDTQFAKNIDKEGHVLYLDQDLLDRKEVGFPPYRNKPNGLGIYNWLLRNVLYMSKKRWSLALKLYHLFVKYSAWMKKGGWKARFYKKGIKLYPDMERQTGTIQIDQEKCVGCGICQARCNHDVIHIRQTMPMRQDLHEYFLKDYNLDIKLD